MAETLHQLQVEVKRATKAPAKARLAVHLSLTDKGVEVRHQQTAPKPGPNPQWQQQFTFAVSGLADPILTVSLRNAQTGQVLGHETVNVTELPLNRPLSQDLGLKGAKGTGVFVVLLATSQPAGQRRPSPASSDHSIGAESTLPLPLDRPAPRPPPTQPLLPAGVEVKVTSAKGFESLPACAMCVEARCGPWAARTPPLPNQAVALWHHPLGVAPLGEGRWPLALAVLDSDTALVLGSGHLDLASLPWATNPAQMQSVLMTAGEVPVGTVSVLLRAADPAAPAPPPPRPPPRLPAPPSPRVPPTPSGGGLLVVPARRPYPATSTALVELQLHAPAGMGAASVLRLTLPGGDWTHSTPPLQGWRAGLHRVAVPVPQHRPPGLRLDVALHRSAESVDPIGVGSLDLAGISERSEVHRLALAHPTTGRPAGTLEVGARFLLPVPARPAARPAEAAAVPFGDSTAALSAADELVAGTLHVRSLEFKLGGADGGFWEREALLAAQVTLKSSASVVGQRTRPTAKGAVVRWADGLRFALSDRAATVEVQLWEQPGSPGAAQQLMGTCSVALPDREQEQRVKVLLRPTPLYAQLTMTVLAQYSVTYGHNGSPLLHQTPLEGAGSDPPDLWEPPHPPPPPPVASAPVPSPPTSRPLTPAGRKPSAGAGGQPPARRGGASLVPTPPSGPLTPAEPPGAMVPMTQARALAAVGSPGRPCPAYVQVARSKDSLQTLSGALAPVSFLVTMAARSPAVTAGLCFGVLLLSYLNWLLQLALLVALGTVVGSNVVRATLATMPPKAVRQVHRAADDAEERLLGLAAALAGVSRFCVLRRPTAGLAGLGGLLLLSALTPTYGISLVVGTGVLSFLLPLPAEDIAADPYLRAKPLLVLLPWYAVTGWLDDGLMLLGATLYFVGFLHVPILRDYPPGSSVHALRCVLQAAASGIRRPFVGLLHVRVLGAELQGETASLQSFAMLSAEKGQLRYTRVASGPAPQWDEEWEPVLVSNVQSLRLQVWDASNGGDGGGHGLLGEATLNVRGPAEEAEKAVPLSSGRGTAGRLRLRMRVSPVAGE